MKIKREKNGKVDEAQRLSAAPVVDLVVRYDDRSGQVSVTAIGGTVSYEQARWMLDLAREYLVQRETAERAASTSAAAQEVA